MKGKLRRNNVYEYYHAQEEAWTEEEVDLAMAFCQNYQQTAYQTYYTNGLRRNQPFSSSKEATALNDFFQSIERNLPTSRETLRLAKENGWSKTSLYQAMRKNLSIDRVSRRDPIRYFLENGYSPEETKTAIRLLTGSAKRAYEELFGEKHLVSYQEYVSKNKAKVTNIYRSLQLKLDKIHIVVAALDQSNIDLEDLVARMKQRSKTTLKFCGRNNSFLYLQNDEDSWQREEVTLSLQCMKVEAQEQYRAFYDENGNLHGGIESSKIVHKLDSLFSSMRTQLRRNRLMIYALYEVRNGNKDQKVVKESIENASSNRLSNLSLAPALGGLMIAQLKLLQDRKPVLAILQKTLHVSEEEALEVMHQSILAFETLSRNQTKEKIKNKMG